MIKDKILCGLFLLLGVAILYALFAQKDINEYFYKISDSDVEAGELILANASDDGQIKYHIVPTTPNLDYGYFKQKIDNHEYTFISVFDPEDHNRVLDVIPKKDLITGLTEFVSSASPEYDLVWNLYYNQGKYKIIHTSDIMTTAPYSTQSKPQYMHDIFIHTLH
jgi:hypothetical protein